MAPSRLDIARHGKKLQVIKMNNVAYMRFQSGGMTFLGNENLNGCAVVVIVSKPRFLAKYPHNLPDRIPVKQQATLI